MENIPPTEVLEKKLKDLEKRALVSDDKKAVSGFGMIVLIISDLVGGLVLGAALGVLSWKMLGWGPLSFGIFFILGGIGGLLNLHRYLGEKG